MRLLPDFLKKALIKLAKDFHCGPNCLPLQLGNQWWLSVFGKLHRHVNKHGRVFSLQRRVGKLKPNDGTVGIRRYCGCAYLCAAAPAGSPMSPLS